MSESCKLLGENRYTWHFILYAILYIFVDIEVPLSCYGKMFKTTRLFHN